MTTSQHVRPNAEVDAYTPTDGDYLGFEEWLDGIRQEQEDLMIEAANCAFDFASVDESAIDFSPLHN